MTQAHFGRLTGASRDDWRKWSQRELVEKAGGGYTWPQIVEGLALRAMEEAAGIDVVAQCWDDVHAGLLSHIRQVTLDVVIDPGVSPASRPRLRAFISTDDERTAALARTARQPHVLPLADEIAAAREEFDRTVARASAHADRGRRRDARRDAANG